MPIKGLSGFLQAGPLVRAKRMPSKLGLAEEFNAAVRRHRDLGSSDPGAKALGDLADTYKTSPAEIASRIRSIGFGEYAWNVAGKPIAVFGGTGGALMGGAKVLSDRRTKEERIYDKYEHLDRATSPNHRVRPDSWRFD